MKKRLRNPPPVPAGEKQYYLHTGLLCERKPGDYFPIQPIAGHHGQEEAEQILSCLKKTPFRRVGEKSAGRRFSTQQVADSDEHRLLMALRNSSLTNEEALQAFYQKVTQALVMEGNYMILLAFDTYDVPYRSKDGGNPDGYIQRGVFLSRVQHLSGENDKACPELFCPG